MNKGILLTIFLAAVWSCCSLNGRAQSLSEYRDRLADPAPGDANGARVTVVEHASAAEAVRRAAAAERGEWRFKGYRVCIFFDNGQNARAEAEAARELFAQTYPETSVYIAYNAPYFTVTVGDCVTVEEAIILMGRIRGTFPKAFPRSEMLTLADLLKKS